LLPPQFVPGAVFVRPDVHCDAPVEHEVVPVVQPLLMLHPAPAVQLQWPAPSQAL
jgi:hypothetical protein